MKEQQIKTISMCVQGKSSYSHWACIILNSGLLCTVMGKMQHSSNLPNHIRSLKDGRGYLLLLTQLIENAESALKSENKNYTTKRAALSIENFQASGITATNEFQDVRK